MNVLLVIIICYAPALMRRRTCCGSSFITPVLPSRMRLFLIAVSFLFSFDGEFDVISSFSSGISTIDGRKITLSQSGSNIVQFTFANLVISNININPKLKKEIIFRKSQILWKKIQDIRILNVPRMIFSSFGSSVMTGGTSMWSISWSSQMMLSSQRPYTSSSLSMGKIENQGQSSSCEAGNEQKKGMMQSRLDSQVNM